MAIKSPLYKDGLSAVTGTQVVAVIDDLDTIMEDNSAAIVDIYSWAIYTSDPDNINEFSSLNYRQLLVKKASGTITIENTRVIEDNTNLSGVLDIVWSEAINGTDIELSAEITALNATVYRRATVTLLKA